MNKAQIIELLKKLQKFEFFGGDIRHIAEMDESEFGDYVKFEDVCKLFDLKVNVINQIEE